MIVDVFNVYLFKEVVRCVSSQPFSPSNFKDHLSVRRDPLELRDWFIWLMCQGEFGTFVSSPPKKQVGVHLALGISTQLCDQWVWFHGIKQNMTNKMAVSSGLRCLKEAVGTPGCFLVVLVDHFSGLYPIGIPKRTSLGNFQWGHVRHVQPLRCDGSRIAG